MSQLAPTASGTIAATPFGHLLIYALDRRLTGSMVFEEPDHRKHAVYFVHGAPAAARTAAVVAPLGELAVERDVLAAERLEAALAAAKEAGRRLGEQLLDWVLLDEAALDALLREQVARRVKELRLLPPATAYGYYEAKNFLERAGGPREPCAPLPLIWRVMRTSADPLRAAETIARLQDAPLRFHSDAPLAHFDLEPDEQAVVDVLRAKPQPFSELLGRDLLERPVLERLLFTLMLLRHFDTGGGHSPVGAERRSMSSFASVPAMPATSLPPLAASTPAPAPAAPAAARTPAPATTPAPSPPAPSPSPAPSPAPAPPGAGSDDPLRREAAERSREVKQSYYEVLGVPEDAQPSAIAAAYFQLAKRWHPDRLGPQYADLRDVGARIFARIGEAHQVLADEDQRKQYDELLKEGGGDAAEQEQVQKLLRATTNFQKAQVLLKRGNLAAAEEAARAALTDAPDEADHIALVAWLEALKQGADLEARLRELNRAVKLEEVNLRARWYRGQVLKRLGRERQAIEDFRLIAEKDPRHVDAQREIRLFDMQRGRKSASDAPAEGRSSDPSPRASIPTPEKGGSFLGKLFKK
jgi:curved DNA-binding protein CbpA